MFLYKREGMKYILDSRFKKRLKTHHDVEQSKSGEFAFVNFGTCTNSDSGKTEYNCGFRWERQNLPPPLPFTPLKNGKFVVKAEICVWLSIGKSSKLPLSHTKWRIIDNLWMQEQKKTAYFQNSQ